MREEGGRERERERERGRVREKSPRAKETVAKKKTARGKKKRPSENSSGFLYRKHVMIKHYVTVISGVHSRDERPCKGKERGRREKRSARKG
jgi:hypothetical protein